MTLSEFDLSFDPLYGTFTNLAVVNGETRPLHLAHYTSLGTLEKIISHNELWFSNPLFMNDHQEMRFGLHKASEMLGRLAQDANIIASIGGERNYAALARAFQRTFDDFDVYHSLDVYVFCMSEYDAHAQPDGLLSMWRGYGANGQGAALVFNTGFVTLTPESPLLIAKVAYTCVPERIARMEATLRRCIEILVSASINEDTISSAGFHMFQLMLFDSLLSKDNGFKEEQEWRVIYLPHRDVRSLMKDQRTYLIRNNAVEPKLRFPIEPLKLEPRQSWTFNSIVERIVLGPTHGSALAKNSAKRMLQCLGKPELAERIWVSEIPYRPIVR